VMVCIRCYGLFSRSIKETKGEETLHSHFLLLMEISQVKVAASLDDTLDLDFEAKPDNFKAILFRQKQLNSLLMAFGHIIEQFSRLHQREAKHVLDFFLLGIKSHAFFFESYKMKLYDALVHLVNKIFKHQIVAKFWIKRAVTEMLKICYQLPDSVIFQRDEEMKSIKKSCALLTNLLTHENWDPEAKELFLREVIESIIEMFENLSLGYKESSFVDGRRIFVPDKHDDQYLSFRLALVFEEIQKNGNLDEGLKNGYCLLLVTIANDLEKYPRTLSLQKMLRSLYIIGDRLDEFLAQDENTIYEVQKIWGSIFLKTFDQIKEFQEEILFDALKT
jgi:hypothetical protein